MKRIGRTAIEIIISLGYPALISLLSISFLVFTSQPSPDGTPAIGNTQSIVYCVIAISSFVAIILYGVWDWDREPIAGFVYRLLFFALRIAVIPVFFFPFLFIWTYVLSGIFALFGIL